MAKYRVTLSSYQYHTVDVEADSPDEAENIVNERLNRDEYSLANEYNTYDEGTYVVGGEAYEVE